ncbi:TPM domain-containing protein [Massilia horti]|uniref:YgcG family protein n=1 Tax=Massilia horti TaxID=2562153 RepID=A0A4Y9T2K1_9BURK|nr:TPM domain-containing protein [Massilia horti]TFW31828.1 YgcG family protein [Massilia horti]
MFLLRPLWILALAFCLVAPAHAQFKPVPPLRGHVNDEIGMLTPDQRASLESMLSEYEAKTGSQIAVLLVASTEPEAIEQYSIRVTDAWKLGRKGVDDGVLLLVARDNPSSLRRLRIEAGRGVQGVLTDVQSKRILQDVIAPYFREQHYYDGLVAGVGAIESLLDQEKFPGPRQAQQQHGSGISLFGLLAIIVGIFVILSMFRPRRSRLSGGGWSSGATGFIIGNILGNMSRGGYRGGGGFGGGGWGGGGYSGGGGTFDGGGASGDW